jgi:hypothetical protein
VSGHINRQAVDVTARTDEAAITALCTFGEIVKTSAGEIHPTLAGFELRVGERKPREFSTASGAVEVLRRISK